MFLKSSIETLMRAESLKGIVCHEVLNEILNPNMNPLQVAAFLALLRAKRETTEELFAFIKALQKKMIEVPTISTVLDIVGTGGDGLNTINISTGSAILAASCGVKIAKHGNRASSSQTGSADVLEALGVNIELTKDQINHCIEKVGIGFCFSPNFHPITGHLRQIRKQLNIPTTFNIIGPLLNPARASYTILGVYDESLMPIMADLLIELGSKRSIIVHGCGLDEISTVGPAKVIEIDQGQKIEYLLDPIEYGFPYCQTKDLRGGDPDINANLLLKAFQGGKGPISDTLILNAAAAMYLYGLQPSIAEAVLYVRENLYSGLALKLLNHWIECSHE